MLVSNRIDLDFSAATSAEIIAVPPWRPTPASALGAVVAGREMDR
jgi:hypothetical protein